MPTKNADAISPTMDAANGVNSAITLPVIGALVVATIVIARRDATPLAVAAA